MQAPSDRTTIRRAAARARYDRESLHAVLDEGLVAHIAAVMPHGPVVLPTAYARMGDEIVVHGSGANALLRRIARGAPASIAVTILDGLVLAKSAFHHSVNYRSVVLFASGREVTQAQEKERALDCLLERLQAGRSSAVRRATPDELRQTLVVAFPIDEASVKVRSGPPNNDEADLDWPVWSGVVPVSLVVAEPIET